MDLLFFAASSRKDSLNKKLVEAAKTLAPVGREIQVMSLADFPMPVYDGDFEAKEGVPAAALALTQKIIAAKAVIISAPEYNGGISGAFKNAIDWTSRLKPQPWAQKPVLLLGASPGALGAVRGLWHTRVPLEALGAVVYPDMLGIGGAHQAFGEDGALKDGKQAERLQSLLQNFANFFKL